MTKVYPVILTPTKDGYVVTVPDLDINTQGKDLAEAIYMARDAIGLWGICEQDDGHIIPEPSTSEPLHDSNELISWVDIDFTQYRKANEQRTVRRNVSLPSWLNFEAEKAGINVSAVLQTALKQELKIK